MTLIGEVPPGLAATAARIGDAGNRPRRGPGHRRSSREQLAAHPFDGRSVCVLVPDATRTCPLPLLLRAVHGALHGRVSRLTVLIALGTHAAMGEEALAGHLGYAAGQLEQTYPGTDGGQPRVVAPETFVDLGTVPASRIVELSEGRMRLDVPVLLNRAVVEHDVALVVGPVLPHEVVGHLRRQQVLLPRRRRPEDHRRLALAGRADHVGGDHRYHRDHPGAGADRRRRGAHPVGEARALRGDRRGRRRGGGRGRRRGRALADPRQRAALGVVRRHPSVVGVRSRGVRGHARHLPDAPVRRVLSIVPPMYDEIWTGAKGFYKLEPVVADGGEVILYAPHITRDLLHPPGDLRHRLPLPRLLREAVGPVRARATGACWRTRRTCAAPAPTTRRPARSGCACR